MNRSPLPNTNATKIDFDLVVSIEKSAYSVHRGIPPQDFFERAWESEILTKTLMNVHISLVLPMPAVELSLIAVNLEKCCVGQCSANRALAYWQHIENLDHVKLCHQNFSTHAFAKIHEKAVQAEKRHLTKLNLPAHKALHNAGIAILPEYRGNKIGLKLTLKQIELAKNHGYTSIFCETTNCYSAAIMATLGFNKVAEYPYVDLAKEFNHLPLQQVNDAFTVWCIKL